MSARLSPGQTGAKSSLRECCPRECGDPDPPVKPAGVRFLASLCSARKLGDPTPRAQHAHDLAPALAGLNRFWVQHCLRGAAIYAFPGHPFVPAPGLGKESRLSNSAAKNGALVKDLALVCTRQLVPFRLYQWRIANMSCLRLTYSGYVWPNLLATDQRMV